MFEPNKDERSLVNEWRPLLVTSSIPQRFEPVYHKQRRRLLIFRLYTKSFSLTRMATRTSSRSTKAVKFVDGAESDGNEDFEAAARLPTEEKKVRGRSNPARRKGNNDDEDWDAKDEQIEDDDDDEEEEGGEENNDEHHNQDATKKFKGNPSGDSVYDFG